MSTYAMLVKNVVDSVIVAEKTFCEHLVQTTPCTGYVEINNQCVSPGDIHLGGGLFESPAPVVVERTVISRDEFFGRLTDDEYGGLIQLSRRDDAVGTKVSGFLRWLEILGAVDLASDRVVTGFQWLVDQGYLTTERRDEILAPIEEIT